MSKNKYKKLPPQRIRINAFNIDRFPEWKEKLDKGEVMFDSTGRLRFSHGAPVGDMVFKHWTKAGQPVYKQSMKDWFEPNSEKALAFKWPE